MISLPSFAGIWVKKQISNFLVQLIIQYLLTWQLDYENSFVGWQLIIKTMCQKKQDSLKVIVL